MNRREFLKGIVAVAVGAIVMPMQVVKAVTPISGDILWLPDGLPHVCNTDLPLGNSWADMVGLMVQDSMAGDVGATWRVVYDPGITIGAWCWQDGIFYTADIPMGDYLTKREYFPEPGMWAVAYP